MLSSRFLRLARLDRLQPREGVAERAIALAFTARFTDEVLSGAWTVLTPTFRRVFRLSLVQIGLLSQVLEWVAVGVEPVTATMIDFHSRRRLLFLGATVLTVSMLTMASARSYGWLLLGFAAYGLGSGALCQTADVLVVESFPAAAERAYARATFVDTTGALLGPGLIAAAAVTGISWRLVLAAVAGAAAAYAAAAWATDFPPPPRARDGEKEPILAAVVAGIRSAVASPQIRRPLIVLFCFDIFETAFVLKYIWLHDSVGLSTSAVALWAVIEQVVDLVALVLLDRWLATRAARQVLQVAAAALVVLPAAWVLAPGVAGRIAVGVPLTFAHALLWPLAKAESLTADAELAGAAQAVTAIFPIIPFALAQSALAEAVGIGPAMAVTAALGAASMLLASRRQSP